MTAITTRMQKLEDASGPGRITLVVRYIVAPGQTERTVTRVTSEAQVWHRRPGETEDELLDRAASEARRNQQNVALLVAD